jgi:hypothetical protein
MQKDLIDKTIRIKINNNLKELKNIKSSRFNYLSREEFLNLTYRYLIFKDNTTQISLKYRDLKEKENKKANTIFDKNNTWKDKF